MPFFLTLNAIEAKKDAKRPNLGKLYISGKVDLKFCPPNIKRGQMKCPKYKCGLRLKYLAFMTQNGHPRSQNFIV